jgi:hypothetical protein
MQFSKAQRKRSKLRLALAGPAGSGKTWGALEIAKGLGGKVAVIDTERGSASLYSDRADFDVLELNPPFTPERCIEAIRAAEKAEYDIIIFDSITHEWNGSGGCLEINDTWANLKCRGNTWAAWNETTPRHRAFVDSILQSPCHIIATLRSKTETVQGDDKKVRKLGMKAEQRDGTEYEFTVVLDLEHERHIAVKSKDRTQLFSEPHRISTDTGKRLRDWLELGIELPPEVKLIDKHLQAIRNSASMEELKTAIQLTNLDKNKLSDADKALIAAAKDARKSELNGPEAMFNGTHATTGDLAAVKG